ncbi:MAG TPA: hypothetical protein VGX25_02595 [Actinophytocola sp.]|uniref:hypothetical protein n=1 Tax=Actinophytocola sp. TaxID=1872138 RepID=UPI002DDD134E|nr:hypothetical protein [Actinophytocola sp.]HEV2778266.1 hypothetical protein [Actinophytocola sp.]
MLYLLAAIGAIAVIVLLWRAFVARPASVSPRRTSRSVAPDDDPEFLRRLGERKPRPDDDKKPPPA